MQCHELTDVWTIKVTHKLKHNCSNEMSFNFQKLKVTQTLEKLNFLIYGFFFHMKIHHTENIKHLLGSYKVVSSEGWQQ